MKKGTWSTQLNSHELALHFICLQLLFFSLIHVVLASWWGSPRPKVLGAASPKRTGSDLLHLLGMRLLALWLQLRLPTTHGVGPTVSFPRMAWSGCSSKAPKQCPVLWDMPSLSSEKIAKRLVWMAWFMGSPWKTAGPWCFFLHTFPIKIGGEKLPAEAMGDSQVIGAKSSGLHWSNWRRWMLLAGTSWDISNYHIRGHIIICMYVCNVM